MSDEAVDKSECGSRDAELIKCLETVEDNLLSFLKMKDKKGKVVLIDGVGRLSAEPDKAIQVLSEAFRDVVDPLLLKRFEGTWMAFLLWNDFTGRVQVLYNYSKTKESPQYQFVSGFVSSREFERKFTEPMTDVIFTAKTPEKHVMVFGWSDCPGEEELKRINQVPENIRPLLVSFNNLGGGWQGRLDEIQAFVDSVASVTEENERNRNFAKLATMISTLSKEMLEDKATGVKEIILQAKEVIYSKFDLKDTDETSLIDAEALCRTLIWNRLFDPVWQYLYYIPAKFLSGSAVSGIVCAFRDILPPADYVVLTHIVNRIFSLFHFGSYGQQLNLFALRSATAAIMARNKSHIHGSHIEHGLRNKMEDFSGVIEARLISDQPFYRSLREKLGILDDSQPADALADRISFIEELGIELNQKENLEKKIQLLRDHRPDLDLLEDIVEWLDLDRANRESVS